MKLDRIMNNETNTGSVRQLKLWAQHTM